MIHDSLALHGGEPIIDYKFETYNPIGEAELEAATDVIKSGVLSKFVGSWGPDFYGGPRVQEFERIAAEYFGVSFVVSVNSWTSGLIAAVGSIGTEPGDEIIVPPWTMCASATAILHWNAIPVFADISPTTFTIDPASIEHNVSQYTKAILAVDVFGRSCEIDTILKIARKYNLKVITDTAQSPGGTYQGSKTGTLSDVGGFSLNYHKHIHTGEGGLIVTNDPLICESLQLIRNHGEAVVANKPYTSLANILGYNFRMGEIEAAIGIAQLQKLDSIILDRNIIAAKITSGLSGLDGITLPSPSLDLNSFYVYPILIDPTILEISRETIVEALQAEGLFGLSNGYANVHLLPLFQKKIAYGTNGFPWTSDICKRDISYSKGICPVSEKLHDETFIGFEMCLFRLSPLDIQSLINAFHKVWSNLDDLKQRQHNP